MYYTLMGLYKLILRVECLLRREEEDMLLFGKRVPFQ